MIAENHNTDTLPDTLDGWKSRAKYFESLYKVEKLTSAKLRTTNRNLTHHIYGRSSEKLSEAQRLLFGLLGETVPADLSDDALALMKRPARAFTTAAPMNPKRKAAGARQIGSRTFPKSSR